MFAWVGAVGGRLASRAAGPAQAVGVLQQFASDPFGVGMAISTAFGQHVPNGDQQLAGDGDDGFVAAQARLQAGQCGLSVQYAVHHLPVSFAMQENAV